MLISICMNGMHGKKHEDLFISPDRINFKTLLPFLLWAKALMEFYFHHVCFIRMEKSKHQKKIVKCFFFASICLTQILWSKIVNFPRNVFSSILIDWHNKYLIFTHCVSGWYAMSIRFKDVEDGEGKKVFRDCWPSINPSPISLNC